MVSWPLVHTSATLSCAVAIRVKLEPDMRMAKNGLAVLGASLGLTDFGPGQTAAKKQAPKPATLTFLGAYVSEVRNEPNPDLEPFARLRGKVTLMGPRRIPTMVLEGDAIEHDEPPPDPDDEDAPRPYQLEIGYGTGSFTNPPPPDSALTELRLPAVPDNARFFELGIELEIDGGSEAGPEVNDRLDVPLSTVTFLDVHITDHKDFPLDAEPYSLELFDGSTLTGETDSEGWVRINPIPKGRCILTLSQVEEDPQPDGHHKEETHA